MLLLFQVDPAVRGKRCGYQMHLLPFAMQVIFGGMRFVYNASLLLLVSILESMVVARAFGGERFQSGIAASLI